MQQTKAAVQQVDLENKVQSDMIARALATQGKRITGNEYALTASKLVDEFKAQFPDLVSNDIVKTALPLAPLLFLQPQKRGDGFLSVATDPRVWGPVLAAALTLVSKFRDQTVTEVIVSGPSTLTVASGTLFTFRASARDSNNRSINNRTFEWKPSDPRIATVDTVNSEGKVTAVTPGIVEIRAIDTATKVSGVMTLAVIP